MIRNHTNNLQRCKMNCIRKLRMHNKIILPQVSRPAFNIITAKEVFWCYNESAFYCLKLHNNGTFSVAWENECWPGNKVKCEFSSQIKIFS